LQEAKSKTTEKAKMTDFFISPSDKPTLFKIISDSDGINKLKDHFAGPIIGHLQIPHHPHSSPWRKKIDVRLPIKATT
jgi:hypothetical protein